MSDNTLSSYCQVGILNEEQAMAMRSFVAFSTGPVSPDGQILVLHFPPKPALLYIISIGRTNSDRRWVQRE